MIRLLIVLLFSFAISACATQDGGISNSESAAEINVRLGLGYLQQGRPKLAIGNFKRAIALDPRLADAHHYAAESYRRMRQYAYADKHFKKALKLAPKDSAIKNNYGVYLCGQEQYAEADRYFVEAINDKFYNSIAEALENAGLCARKAGDSVLAAERFHQALEHDSRRVRSLYQLADISFLQGDALNARAFLQRYFSLGQKNAPSLWLAIRIENALDNKDAVREHATALYKNFPGSDEAKKFRDFWANQ